MSTTVYSVQGDTVDLVCYRYYGYVIGIAEMVLESNPGLAAHGPVLPINTKINLPNVTAQTEQKTKKLWD